MLMHTFLMFIIFVKNINMKRLFILSLVLMVTIHATSQDYKKLEHYLDTKIVGEITPGAQFIIADSSGILFEYNNGIANMEKQEKVTSDTQFKMYSSTKMLTTIAIMQLVEKGKINLDSPISDYLDYEIPKEVTIRKTLSHTAGFSKYPFVKEIHLTDEHDKFSYSAFMDEMIPKHKELKYKPGRKNSYSNTGFLLLSAVIEKVSGMEYEEYIQKNIIQLANLNPDQHVGFVYTDKTATGYQKRRTMMHWLYSKMVDTDKFYGKKTKDWQSYNNLYMQGIGFGGGFANSKGLAELFLNVLNYNLLNEHTLQTTFEEQIYKKNKVAKQALGWWNGMVSGNKAYHHAGGAGGYSCEIRIYPEKGLVRIMMMNKTQSLRDLKMFSEIDKLWIE